MPNESQMTEAELDHIAAGIRPSWELDDAPFRPGGLASPQLEALLAGNVGNGVSHTHTNGAAAAITAQRVVSLNHEPEEMRTRIDPVPPAPVLEDAPIAPVRVEPRIEPAAPLPVPQFAAPAVAQAAAVPQSTRPPAPAVAPPSVQIAPSHPPPSISQGPVPSSKGNGVAMSAQADPFAAPQEKARPKAARAKATSSADFPAIKKSNKGLFIALGGGAVVIVVAAIALTTGSSKNDATKVSASPTATQMPGASATHEIPPPPATDDLPTATAAATQTAAPTATATQAIELPAQTTAPITPPPPATHVAHNDAPPPQATHHAAPPPVHPNPPPTGGGGKSKGGIVRDVPF